MHKTLKVFCTDHWRPHNHSNKLLRDINYTKQPTLCYVLTGQLDTDSELSRKRLDPKVEDPDSFVFLLLVSLPGSGRELRRVISVEPFATCHHKRDHDLL